MARLLLWLFAAIGFVTVVYAYFLKSALAPLAGEEARVLQVTEGPSGLEAAVIYVHDHQNSSGKFLAVKLVRRPFPEVGDAIDPYDDVFRVVGDEESWKKYKPITVQWWKKSPLSPPGLDVCAPNAGLVRFDKGLFGDAMTDVTLCEAPRQAP